MSPNTTETAIGRTHARVSSAWKLQPSMHPTENLPNEKYQNTVLLDSCLHLNKIQIYEGEDIQEPYVLGRERDGVDSRNEGDGLKEHKHVF